MTGQLVFPVSKDALVEAMEVAVQEAMIQRNIASVRWWISLYYLQGYRRIRVHNWRTGKVVASLENKKGELEFSYEKLVDMYRTEVGRLMRMAVGPSVSREGFGLQSVRDAGIAQAVLSYMTSKATIHSEKRALGRIVELAVRYGTFGLHHYRSELFDDIGERTGTEAIVPWELLCMPGEISALDEQRGLFRHRAVPLEWVRARPGFEKAAEADLETFEVPHGAAPPTGGPEGHTSSGGSAAANATAARRERDLQDVSRSRKDRPGEDSKAQKWVWFTEGWISGDREDLVSRYISKGGKVIGEDEQYHDIGKGKRLQKVVCPIAVGRYVSTGGFYGRSLVDIHMGLNYQLEKMLRNQFQNVADTSNFGFLVFPTTSGITRTEVLKQERRKVLFAEPNPLAPNFVPFAIDPAKPSPANVKTIELATALQKGMSGQSDILQGDSPGRVDSAAALGFLHETSGVNLISTSNSIADAFAQIYASMLQTARSEAQQAGEAKALRLPVLDDRMLGVVLDRMTGEIQLGQDNPIPDPWSVNIDIEERVLRSREQQKQEAGLMLEARIITPQQFRILNEKEDLGFPILGRRDFEQWRKAVLMKILIFNDGKEPGQALGGEEYDDPTIMLQVLLELMGSVEFTVASESVREAFIQVKTIYEQMMGKFPNQLLQDFSEQGPQQGPTQGQPAPQLQ